MQLDDLHQTNGQLRDQNTLLKAQLSAGAVTDVPDLEIITMKAPDDYVALQEKLKELQNENEAKDGELERLRKDQDDLLELLTDQDVRLNSFKSRLRELGEDIKDDDDSDNNSVEDVDVK